MSKYLNFSEQKMRWSAFALAALAAFGVGRVYGWSSNGHQTVGAIADALIAGHRAAKQVASILGTAQGKQLTLSDVAVWADCVRNVHPESGFTYDPGKFKEPACAIFEDDAGKAAMIDYAKRNNSNCEYDGKNMDCHKAFHFADIPMQHSAYKATFLGANDHDVVHAINATLAVLQEQPAPAPFDIASKKEALMLLVHFVGDLHQPLHVAAMYLDQNGKIVDPESGVFDPKSDTHGGNSIGPASDNLHHRWDETKYVLTAGAAPSNLMKSAKAVPVQNVDITDAPTVWASDTVVIARTKAFPGVKTGPFSDSSHSWPLTADPKGRSKTQATQVAKGGARLAALLEALWPDEN